MNYRLAQRAQTDAWYDRHGVNAYKSTLFQTQIASAINADHSAALDMNANDDSGRAAFLGHLTRAQKIAHLHATADWLAAHPEEEFDRVLITRTRSSEDEIDEATRVAPVLAFAARHDTTASEDEYAVTAWHTLADNPDLRIVLMSKALLNFGTTRPGKYVKLTTIGRVN